MADRVHGLGDPVGQCRDVVAGQHLLGGRLVAPQADRKVLQQVADPAGAQSQPALHPFDRALIPGQQRQAQVGAISLAVERTNAQCRVVAASECKVRMGGPVDDEDDVRLPHWAGVLPLTLRPGTPIPADGLDAIPLPAYLADYRRR